MQAVRTRLTSLQAAAKRLSASAQLAEALAATPKRSFWVARVCTRRVPVSNDHPARIFEELNEPMWRPFAPLARSVLANMQADMRVLRDEFWSDLSHAVESKGRTIGLGVRVAETEANFKLVADLPGVEREAVKVTVSNEGTLSISATRAEEVLAQKGAEGASESKFMRVIRLPTEVDKEAIQASLKNGRLEIIVPKSAAPKPVEKEISIASA